MPETEKNDPELIASLNNYFHRDGYRSDLCSSPYHQDFVRNFLLIQHLEPNLGFRDSFRIAENSNIYFDWRMRKGLTRAEISMIKDLLQKLGLWYKTDETGAKTNGK